MTRSGFDDLLESALRVRPGEGRRVAYMFVYLLCAVSAFIVGRTVRDTLFLARYDVSTLPLMYVGTAVGVAAAAYAYSRVADRFRRDRIIHISLAIATASLVGLWLVLASNRGESWIYPALYVAVEIIGAISIIQFWTFANDIFSSREAKRLFGLIGAGGVLANVLCGVGVRGAVSAFGAENLVPVAGVLLVLCAVCVRGVSRHVGRDLDVPVRRTQNRTVLSKDSAAEVLRSKHLKLIAGLVAVTVLTVTILDIQWKFAARAAYAGHESELAGYFADFYIVTGLIAGAIQFFGTTRLLERHGIATALLVLPVSLVFGFSCLLFAVPTISPLIATTLTKGAENVTRYTINDATMQLLFVPVPGHRRGRAKAFIDGILKPICIGASGLAAFGLGQVARSADVGTALAYVDLVLLIGWIGLVLSIRSEYVRSLVDTLRSRRLDFDGTPALINDEATARVLRQTLASPKEADVLHALELLPHVQVDVLDALPPLLTHPSPTIRMAVLSRLARSDHRKDLEMIEALFEDELDTVRAAAVEAYCALAGDRALSAAERRLSDPSPAVRAAVVVGLIKYTGTEGILLAAATLKTLLAHPEPAARVQGARVLKEIGAANFTQPTLELFADPSAEVRRAAIDAAGAIRSFEFVSPLIGLLAQRATRRDASEALARYGAILEESLLAVLASETVGRNIRHSIPNILGRIGGPNSFAALFETLATRDLGLAAHCAKAAARIRNRRDDVRVDEECTLVTIHRSLEASYQCLAILDDIALAEDELLFDALFVRHKRHLSVAFRLLEILYPPRTVQIVYANLESENRRLRANAMEVIDNVLGKKEAHLVLALVEDHPLSAKARVGTEHFPLVRMSRDEWLFELLEETDPWVVASTLYAIAQRRSMVHRDRVALLLASDDSIVRETACVCLETLLAEGLPPDAGTSVNYVELAEAAAHDDSPVIRRAGTALLATLVAAT